MTDFYVRWGDDVQPYVLQLASEHIETLRKYCNDAAIKILLCRLLSNRIVTVTKRVKSDMLNAAAFHRFEMFGFSFELREGPKKPKARKQEFILNFSAMPDFAPKDMPPRLRRVAGKPLSARPRRRRRPSAARPARAQPVRGKKRKTKKRYLERITYHLRPIWLWIRPRAAVLASSFEDKLYKMYGIHQRLSAHVAVMWRRRPRLNLRVSFLTSEREGDACASARLEPRLTGESLRVLLFTFVSPEPQIDWSAYPFGRLADEGERIAV